MRSLESPSCQTLYCKDAGRRGNLLLSLVVVASLLAGAGVGIERGERQQGAEEHRKGGPEHKQTKCL
jgi:hypothetical protein